MAEADRSVYEEYSDSCLGCNLRLLFRVLWVSRPDRIPLNERDFQRRVAVAPLLPVVWENGKFQHWVDSSLARDAPESSETGPPCGRGNCSAIIEYRFRAVLAKPAHNYGCL